MILYPQESTSTKFQSNVGGSLFFVFPQGLQYRPPAACTSECHKFVFFQPSKTFAPAKPSFKASAALYADQALATAGTFYIVVVPTAAGTVTCGSTHVSVQASSDPSLRARPAPLLLGTALVVGLSYQLLRIGHKFF